MQMTRRNLAAAGALALGAAAFIRPALADAADEAAVKKSVEEFRNAILKKDKAKLDGLTLAALSYSHSDARVQDKTAFIDGVMGGKATVKSLEWPEMTIAVAGPNAIVRHLWVSESELDGKTTNTKIGVMQVWQKAGSDWKLLARASFKLPEPTKPS
jgi:ketosteroid isomerase-like protein